MQVLTKDKEKGIEERRSDKTDMKKGVALEMEELLNKLAVWQTENLMAPHGMDRFLRPLKRTHSASLNSKGGESNGYE